MSSPDIKELVKNLETLFETAYDLSKLNDGRKTEIKRELNGAYIFNKVCLHALAILRLLPESKYSETSETLKIRDYESIAVLIRAIMDAYYTFYYLAIDKVNEVETEFRFLIWDYHSCNRSLEMHQLAQNKDPRVSDLEKEVEYLRVQIREHPSFEPLSSERKRRIIKGDVPILLSNKRIAELAGISVNYHQAMYIYLSSYIHSYPFAIIQISSIGSNAGKTVELLKPLIGDCTGFLSYAIRDFVKLFPEYQPKLDEFAKASIEHWQRNLNCF